MTAPLDDRLLERGRPVARIVLTRGWFIITRAPGPAGVILEVRIPGYPDENQPHPDRAAALMAADEIYDAYREAVSRLAG